MLGFCVILLRIYEYQFLKSEIQCHTCYQLAYWKQANRKGYSRYSFFNKIGICEHIQMRKALIFEL